MTAEIRDPTDAELKVPEYKQDNVEEPRRNVQHPIGAAPRLLLAVWQMSSPTSSRLAVQLGFAQLLVQLLE